jgi:predicted negative regulator of RcsB-dependent stress response
MDEDLAIINTNTRNEKIKNFFLNNKKKIIIILSTLILILICYFGFKEYKKNQKIEVSNLYNSAIINFSKDKRDLTTKTLVNIINKKDPTYSPLSLYFIIDNKLINEKEKINNLFNVLINKTSLEKEIKNLIVYKKALYNADTIDENELLKILNPLINSKTVWKTHALYLIAEYYYSKNEKIKSKEFFNKILISENANKDIMKEAQKRLNRDLSE